MPEPQRRQGSLVITPAHWAKRKGVEFHWCNLKYRAERLKRRLVTPTTASRRYDVSYQAANNAISRLVEPGVLREATGRRFGRVFVADRLLAIIEA